MKLVIATVVLLAASCAAKAQVCTALSCVAAHTAQAQPLPQTPDGKPAVATVSPCGCPNCACVHCHCRPAHPLAGAVVVAVRVLHAHVAEARCEARHAVASFAYHQPVRTAVRRLLCR